MTTPLVDVAEASARLSELISEVEQGNEVIVARNGRPVARIIPWPSPRPQRHPGEWAGRVEITGDFVGSDPDVLDAFAESESSFDS